MRICVAGRLTIEHGTAVLSERDLPGNQARLAFAMLAVEHRHPVARDQIADELWPTRLPRSWETALRAVISKVRTACGRAGLAPGLIENAFGCYQLHLGDGTLDVDVAADSLHTAESQLAHGEPLAAAANALVTCIICRRPFLPGLYNPWTLHRRDKLRDLHVAARQMLAETHAAAGNYTLSARHAEHALELDPYREALHQRLIVSRALAGDLAGAAHCFDRYRTLLRTELGVEPSPETIALVDAALGQRITSNRAPASSQSHALRVSGRRSPTSAT